MSSPFWCNFKILFSRWFKVFIPLSIVSFVTFFELRYYDSLQIFLFNIFLTINYQLYLAFHKWCQRLLVKLINYKTFLETGIDKNTPDWESKIKTFYDKKEEVKK